LEVLDIGGTDPLNYHYKTKSLNTKYEDFPVTQKYSNSYLETTFFF